MTNFLNNLKIESVSKTANSTNYSVVSDTNRWMVCESTNYATPWVVITHGRYSEKRFSKETQDKILKFVWNWLDEQERQAEIEAEAYYSY